MRETGNLSAAQAIGQITLNDGRAIGIEVFPSGDVMFKSQRRMIWLEKGDFEPITLSNPQRER